MKGWPSSLVRSLALGFEVMNLNQYICIKIEVKLPSIPFPNTPMVHQVETRIELPFFYNILYEAYFELSKPLVKIFWKIKVRTNFIDQTLYQPFTKLYNMERFYPHLQHE